MKLIGLGGEVNSIVPKNENYFTRPKNKNNKEKEVIS